MNTSLLSRALSRTSVLLTSAALAVAFLSGGALPAAASGLPSGVTPSVAHAPRDYEAMWADGCIVFEHVTAWPKRCIYGDKSGAFTVALVGDSHASHMFPALEQVAKQYDWRILVFAKVSCPFIDLRVNNVALGREYYECATWNKSVVARVNQYKPDLTIVSNSHWFHMRRASDATTNKEGLGIAREIAKLTSSARTILLADSPVSDYDVPSCLSAHKSNIGRCATPRGDAMYGHGLVEKVAAKAGGITVIDIANKICTTNPCAPVVNNHIVYRDNHHLTATFARSLWPALDALLTPFH